MEFLKELPMEELISVNRGLLEETYKLLILFVKW